MPCDFLERVFQGKAPVVGDLALGEELVQRALSGGYPQALERKSWARKQKWFLDYVTFNVRREYMPSI